MKILICTLLLAIVISLKLTVQAQALPFNEGFENSGSIPSGWSQVYANAPAGNIDWIFQNGGVDGNPANAHNGSYNACFQISSYGDDGTATKLISPCINMSGAVSPALTFWHSQTVWGSDQDELKVYIRTSSTGSWVSVANYTTNVPNWTKRTIYLPGPSSTYYIAFEGIAHYGYGACVDDVEIFDAAAPDVAIKEWTYPNSDCSLSPAENVMVKVMNYSTQPVSNIPIKYSINGGATYINETIASTINPGDSLYYTFSTLANFPIAGFYNCIALVHFSGEINNANDTVYENIIKTKDITSFPFIENFETGTTEYFILNHGAQASTFIYNEAGNKVLRLEGGNSALGWTGSAGNVTASEAWVDNISHQGSAITCTVDATVLTSAELLIDLKQFYSSYDPDYNWFRILINNNQISDVNGVSDFHPATLGSDPYATLIFNLNAYAGTIFNMTLQSSCKYSETYSSPGDIAFVDNIVIRQISSLDAGVLSLDAPASGCGFTNAENITVKIKNHGTGAISGFAVHYKVDAGSIVNETVTTAIAPGDSLNYTFLTTANFSVIGTHTIITWTALAGDQYFPNDSFMVEIMHYPDISTFPFVEDFETGISQTFILQSNEQSDAYIFNNGSSKVLRMEGGIDGLYWIGNTGSTTPTNAWVDNVKYQSSALTCTVNAGSLSSPELVLDLKQTVSNSLSGTKLSWFRVLIDGVQVYDINGVSDFNPITANSDTFKTVTFDLTAYAGMQFTLTLQSSCKFNEANGWPSGGPGDNVFIDNIILRENIITDASVLLNENTKIDIFPNPSDGLFTVCIPNDISLHKFINIEIYDVIGKLIFQSEINPTVGGQKSKIDISTFPKGMYFLKVHDDNNNIILTRKVVIDY
ncbi:MAG: T9SS type A sorting domain-containing protein [Bacteroidota bacterium]